MYKILLLLLLALLPYALIAQTTNQTMPDVGELQKMYGDIIKDMPADAKRAMDSLGIKMPDLNNLPNANQIGQLNTQYEDVLKETPAIKKAAIAHLPNHRLSTAELKSYLANCFTKINALIKEDKRIEAQRLYDQLKLKKYTIGQLTDVAAGLAISGKADHAIWLFAKLSSEQQTNPDLLNNYSSVLTLVGGAQLAIPILQYLNYYIPNHPLLINNLGQAWFALDANDSAKYYLLKCLKLSPDCSAANKSMATISKKEGNDAAALNYLRKSMKFSYSDEGAAALKKAGKPIAKSDLALPFVINPDPIGLRNIALPPYAHNCKESPSIGQLWEKFKNDAAVQRDMYLAKAKKLEPELLAQQQAMMANAMNLKKHAPPLYAKVAPYLSPEINVKATYEATTADVNELNTLKEAWHKRESDINKEAEKTYPNCPGEGCATDAFCAFVTKAHDDNNNKYILASNAIYERLNARGLNDHIIAAGLQINNALYSGKSDIEVEVAVYLAKSAVYDYLATLEYTAIGPYTAFGTCTNPASPANKTIKIWADSTMVQCPVNLNDFGIGCAEITLNCKEFGFVWTEGIVAGFKAKNFDMTQLNGELELRIGIAGGLKFGEKSIAGAEAKAGAYLTIPMRVGPAGAEVMDVNFRTTASIGASIASPLFTPLTEHAQYIDIPANALFYNELGNTERPTAISNLDDKSKLDLKTSFEGNLSLMTGSSDYTISSPIGKIQDAYVAPEKK